MDRKLDKFTIITVAYITLLIIANLMATKLVNLGGMILPSAVLAYPFTFLLGDILTEVWGFKAARKVIWLGFFANAAVVLWTAAGIYMPAASVWNGQEHYAYIFGLVPRIVWGSFMGYLVGEQVNAWTMDYIKRLTGSKLLFLRTIGSSVAGQVLDTIIFFGIAFYGTVPLKVLVVMMITQYLFKVACEAVVGTPLAYLLVGWARK